MKIKESKEHKTPITVPNIVDIQQILICLTLHFPLIFQIYILAESPSGARRSSATIYLPGLLRPTQEGV